MWGRRNKFHAIKTTVDDVVFDSKAEAARYCQLKIKEREGQIKNLEVKPKYRFACGIKYTPDFRYYDNAKKCYVVEDVKGVATRDFVMRKKLMKHEHGIEVEQVKIDSRTSSIVLAAYFGVAKQP